jgi:hypothetical protein
LLAGSEATDGASAGVADFVVLGVVAERGAGTSIALSSRFAATPNLSPRRAGG